MKFKSRDLKDRINTTFFEEFFAIWKIFDRFVFKTSLLEAISNSGHSFQRDRMRFFSIQFRENIWTQRKKKETKDTVFVPKINEFFLLKSLNKEFFWPFFMMIHSFIVKTFCENVLFTKDYLSQNLDFL